MADENNIGASRLLGTNGLQQAVDSLTTQVNKLTNSVNHVSTAFNNMSGSAGRTTGGSQTGNNWNASSNRNNYSGNGGGARFSGGGGLGSGGNNGGGGVFSGLATRLNGMPNGGRAAATIGGAAAVMGGFTAYGNKYMSSNMQMNMYGAQSAVAGGGGTAGLNLSMRQAFTNNNIALSAQDAAQAAYLNQFTFGNSQFGGRVNQGFARGMGQSNAFAYASPTMGATAAARAAQETYSARSFYAANALGLASPIGQGGVKTSMGDIAQSIYRRTFGNQQINQQQFNASVAQGGSLGVNLRYFGTQMGWSADTTQMYQNYLQGMVAAQSKGMTRMEYDNLSQKASQGDKGAINRLSETTGLGKSMFEHQRNLNATRLNRQEDILESLGPAFNQATDVVNKFSEALTNLLKSTGLDKAIGTGAGWGSALSSSMSGFGGAFGAAGGLMTAARLFGRGGGMGGLGGMFRGFGGFGGGGGGAAGGMINATRGASGAYNITSLGNAGMAAQGGGLLARGGVYGLAAAAIGGAGWLGWNSANHDKGGSIGDAMRLTGVLGNPLGAAAMWAGYGRRAYDKWWTGKNKESFWELLNPLGHEKRTTSTDGRAGGGSSANAGGGGSPANGSNANNGATAAQVLKFAQSQLGVPYVWGGTTPGKGLDCSGLVQWAYGQAGVKLPRVSQDQAHEGSPVPVNQVQPGDLLFKGDPATHVAIAMGGGKLLEAPRTGLNVRIRGYSAGEFTSARRVLGAVGNTDSLLNGNTDNAQNTNTLNNAQARSGGNVGNIGGTSEAAVISSALGSIMAALPISSKSRSAGSTSGTDQLGTPGTANGGTGGNDKASLQAYAKSLLAKYGWSSQWNDFDALVMSESSWDVHATNKSSGAYGLPQSLPGNKMKSAGADWQTSGDTQLRWMMDYIKERYGSPSKAWSFHQKNNWYAAGAWSIDKDQTATVHQGEMIIPAQQAESIRQVLLNNSFNPGMQNRGGSGGGITIGSIQVNLPAGWTGTRQDAQVAGRAIMDALVQDKRLKELQRGQ